MADAALGENPYYASLFHATDGGEESGDWAALAIDADATPGNAPVCVARDGSAYGERLSEDALQILADAFHLIPVGSTAGSIHASRCGALLWTGFPAGGETLRTELADAGMGSIPMVATDALKTETYLASTAGAGEGTVLVCPCADLSTAQDLEGQRFVHDYQA